MSSSISAVVVTFNRLEFLKDLIFALKNQTQSIDEIIIVNNSSTDGTLEWLQDQSELTVITQENSGSSGGQFTSIKTAYDKGHEWIWVMDDDVLPERDCLEKLLQFAKPGNVYTPLRYTVEKIPFLNDTISYNLSNPFKSFWVKIVDGNDLKNDLINAIGITFEGPLIHRSVVQKIGLPEKNFFIFADDTEYFIRASKAGVGIFIVTSSRLNRRLPALNKFEFNWKMYYSIRNLIAIDVLHGNQLVRLLRPIGYIIKWLFRVKNIKELKIILRSFLDGYFYKSDK